MYIREIYIKSFRHLHDIHLGPFSQPPEHSDLVVLAGPNGGGKSSILELLGYALSNAWTLNWALRRSFPTNAFEVAVTVTPTERELVREYLRLSKISYADDVLRYFEENGTYYRAYNYVEGMYQKNSALYNRIHDLVTNALRNQYNRPLGFFLKSDRFYPQEGFRRDRIFNYEEIMNREYIWGMAFNTSDVQYKDMFEFLVQQRYHYFRHYGEYCYYRDTSGVDQGAVPSDPLKPYDELLQKLFNGYGFSYKKEEIPSNLFIKLPSGDIVPFGDLSSGEKEVFFILSFFLRHDVSNAVIVIDEPELHLHPELARTLIRTMQAIKPGNQIWLATHNTEIIDEAGRDRVFYIARNRDTQDSVVTPGTDEMEAVRQLKELFGYAGYVGVAKNIVFLEGMDSSSDRKMFTNLFPEYGSQIKFVPSQTSENLARINAAILSILESNLGWIQFYLIRDRDFLTSSVIQSLSGHYSGRLHVLARYHIENYILDEEIIAKVQRDVFGKHTEPVIVTNKLRDIARRLTAETLRDMIEFRLNLIFRPQDFSLGKYMEGEILFSSDGAVVPEKVDQLKGHLTNRIAEIKNSLLVSTDKNALDAIIKECLDEVHKAVFGENDGWRFLFPGRRLLEEYAKVEGLGKPPIFQNSLIKELSRVPERIPVELKKVIQTVYDGGAFTH